MQLRKLITEEKGITLSFVKCPRVFNFLIETQFCHYGEEVGSNPIFDKGSDIKTGIMKKGCPFFEFEQEKMIECNKKQVNPYANKPKIVKSPEDKEKIFNDLKTITIPDNNGITLENNTLSNMSVERASPEAFKIVITEQKNNNNMDALDKKIIDIRNKNLNNNIPQEPLFNTQNSRKIDKDKKDSIEAFTNITRKAPKNKI